MTSGLLENPVNYPGIAKNYVAFWGNKDTAGVTYGLKLHSFIPDSAVNPKRDARYLRNILGPVPTKGLSNGSIRHFGQTASPGKDQSPRQLL